MNGNLDITELKTRKHGTIKFGVGFPPDIADETQLLLSILKSVGGPLLSTLNNVLIPNCDVFIDPGHSLTASRGGSTENALCGFYFTNPTINTFFKNKLTALYGNANMLTKSNFHIEYYLNMIIAKDLFALLSSKGLKVSIADYPNLSNGTEISKVKSDSKQMNPKVFISIHNNAYDDPEGRNTTYGSKGGPHTVVGYRTGETALATLIANSLTKAGIKAHTADTSTFKDSPGIVNQNQTTKVAYMECFFYDNESHIMKMVSSYNVFLNTLASAIISGLNG